MSANADPLERLALLSREFVHRYWNGDADWCCGRLDAGAVLLLPDNALPIVGPNALRQALEQLAATNPRVILLNESYNAATCSDTVFYAAGTCIAYVSTNDANMQEQAMRASFVWRRARNGVPRLVHGHLSACEKTPAGKAVPTLANAATRASGADEHVKRIIKEAGTDNTRNLVLRDGSGTTHYLNSGDIRYLEAQGRRTIVHHRAGLLSVARGIGSLAQEMGSAFVALHRSYLVNAFFVEKVSYKGCVMDDGTVLPVPTRRLSEIKEAIAHARGA